MGCVLFLLVVILNRVLVVPMGFGVLPTFLCLLSFRVFGWLMKNRTALFFSVNRGFSFLGNALVVFLSSRRLKQNLFPPGIIGGSDRGRATP